MSDDSISEGSWFDQGYDGLEEAEKEYENRMGGGDELRRFYLKSPDDPKVRGPWETERDIVFETDEPFCIWEHQLFLNGNWFNWFTCRKNLGHCPICASGDNPYYVGFYVVRDMTGYMTKKGEPGGVGRRVLYPAKRKTINQWQRLRAKRGGLVGKKFSIIRTSKNAPNCGDTFDYEGEVDLASLPETPVGMPNFMEIFKPLSVEQMEKHMGRTVASFSVPEENEDIPF